MPKSLGGIFAFIVTATITVVVGSFVYNRFVAPLVGGLMKKAA
jgi:hypothetical protein